MSKTWREIHPDFRLNRVRYSFDDLWDMGYSLVKEGEAFERHIGNFLLDWIGEKDTIAVQTSGSTGTPKTIQLKKEHIVNSASATGSFFDLKSGQSALLCLPCGFIAGKMMLVRALVLGLHLEYIEPISNPLAGMDKSYGFCAMVPLQAENSLPKLTSIKKLIVGGAPISHVLGEKLKSLPTQVFETYGMTETITHIAAKRMDDEGSFFKVLPNVTISKDKRGCLVIDAPNIGVHQLATNDLVELHGDDKFVWLGRYDNVINSGGIKLIPEQIEEKLNDILDSRFFVVGIPDERLGEKLVLVVEGTYDTEKLNEDVKKLESLSEYEVPKEILRAHKFIETGNGKIKRAATLKEALQN
ncbi:AMP-binding protein [Allomuricauda sp. d1]|uniref:AMP-binding protein n=1 Tax=Allomuricauda sp. d1 TaxID=3136725 RepID=UPI0031D72289